MQTTTFNQAQREVLNVMSCLTSEQDLNDLKRMLIRFLNERAQRELDDLWNKGIVNERTFEDCKREHLRTKYV